MADRLTKLALLHPRGAVGTDGTGHRIASDLAHSLRPPYPALVPKPGTPNPQTSTLNLKT